MKSEDYPILSELYDYIEIEYLNFDEQKPQLYTCLLYTSRCV